jgi:hypothetical protein
VAPHQQVSISLVYRGTPQLLREDYSRVNSLGRDEPTSFIRPVRTYLTADIVLLQRDGDWRVWPLTSASHLSQDQQIQLTVPDYHTFLSSSEAIQRSGQQMTYTWSKQAPQLLLLSGPYLLSQTAEGDIYTATMSSPRDRERAKILLQLRRELADWLQEPPGIYQATALPYTQEVVTGGSIVGFPAAAGIPFSPSQDATYQEIRWLHGALALQLVKNILTERIAWSTAPLHTDGQPRSVSIECAYNATGKEICTRQIRGEHTPQAPYGRLVEPDIPSPLLQAWSIVISRHIARDFLSPPILAEERDLWHTLSQPQQSVDFDLYINTLHTLQRRGLLPNIRPDEHEKAHHIAQLVVQIDNHYQRMGAKALVLLLNEIAVAHPPGRNPLTEEAFQQWLTSETTASKDD